MPARCRACTSPRTVAAKGWACAGMAAVVDLALEHIAPVVSLYVNAHNEAARRVYEKVGFRQTSTFTTIMF